MAMPYQYSAIREAMQSKKEEIRDRLVSLARIPSVRGRAEMGAPYGIPCRDVLRAVEKIHRDSGYQTGLREDRGYLLTYAGNRSGKHTIGLFAHADVVPPGGDWLFTSPFEPVEKDGFLIGRGVFDNKAGILMALYAAKTIEELNIPLSSKLLIYTGSDEESGMSDLKAFADHEEMPDISLVPDNGFPVCRGERGIYRWYAVSGGTFSDDVVSVEGGSAFNAVLGSAKAVLRYSEGLEEYLERSVPSDGLITYAREGDNIVLSTHGITSHAARPGDAVHGIYLISALLGGCGVLSENDRSIFREASFLTKDCYGGGFGIASEDPDFGELTCVNGIASVTDRKLSLSFDCRYGTSFGPELVEAKVSGTLSRIGWEYILVSNSHGYQIPRESPIVRRLLKVYDDCTGTEGSESYLSAGGTYARYLKNAFSMCDFHCPAPFDVRKGHGAAHQPDEMISLEGLLDAASILTEMILACDSFLDE